MTKKELSVLMRGLESVFDIVRLVNVSETEQISVDDDGNFKEQNYNCYAVWNKTHRCENCISAKALTNKSRVTKFEFIGNDVYYAVAKYIEIDGYDYVLEMVSKITDEILFGAYGKNEFVESITTYNKKLYLDALTGAYNRHYYDEHLKELTGSAAAMFDADFFKGINDNFGHKAGDIALHTIAAITLRCISEADTLVRYGGDEFLLVFKDITQDELEHTLECIRSEVNSTVIDEYPEIRLSVSMGGVYGKGKFDKLIHMADEMLYKAKQTRNTVKINVLEN